MTPTSVGMRCPECAGDRTKVRTAASLRGDPQLTYALIAACVITYVAVAMSGGGIEGPGSRIYAWGALIPSEVADGEWWRIVTNGFLHYGPLHIAFNMYILYFLGTMMEPEIGTLRFGLIYLVSLLGGSLGAILTLKGGYSVGASTGVFGLMGAAFVMLQARGINPMQTGIGITLLLNLAITFLIPGISKGGHVGGLLAGALVGYLMFHVGERRREAQKPVLLGCGALAVALAVACVAAA